MVSLNYVYASYLLLKFEYKGLVFCNSSMFIVCNVHSYKIIYSYEILHLVYKSREHLRITYDTNK